MPYIKPEWAPLAAAALSRLRDEYLHYTDDLRFDGSRPWQRRESAGRTERKMSDRNSSPLDWLAASPTATQIPLHDQLEVLDADGDPLTFDSDGRNRPAVHVPATDLAFLFRLCATIGSVEGAAAITKANAITVIETGENVDLSDVCLMLAATILPEDAKVVRALELGDPKRTPDLCVIEIGPDDRKKVRSTQKATEALIRGLEAPCPVLIVTEDCAAIPDDIRCALPDPLRLAPLSRDVVMAIIAAHSSATGKIDPRVFDALPDDVELGRLSEASLMLALRASTPKAIAARLSELAVTPATHHPLSLDDIEGYGEAEAIARRMVSDLQAWSAGSVDWRDVQRSVLFYGPPGTGKSHLATAMAGSAGATLVRGSFAEWQAKGHLGDMLRAMRACFAEAAASAPAIIVIDEIDAVGDRGDPERHNTNYRTQVINAFLLTLDGLASSEGVMLVATTNYPDKIDAAILRPGRIDAMANVPLPGPRALERMLRDGLGAGVSSVEITRLVRAATGGTAADVDGALRQARSVARHHGRDMTVEDLLHALGSEAGEKNPAWERRVALHECGHAIVGTCLGIGRITRVVLTRDGGQAWMSYATGKSVLSDLKDELAYALAGRAAERLILGSVAAGSGGNAMSDLARATQTATDIDLRFGLGAEGPVWLDMASAAYLRIPENVARIRARLEAAEASATRILEERRDLLIRMAKDLVEVGLLEGEKLEAWLEDVRKEILPAGSRLLGPDAPACPDPMRSREIGNAEDGDATSRDERSP
ncbi:AAA family ATPase [Roseovarius nanhaiticus]|uniref:AAA family ATPase n=1 Tax=Roseovarius nanhaiticus TaxID=573024 RepID=UPI0024933F55|nr:AAA family ATPase [Roseovarius nanhaiticus]